MIWFIISAILLLMGVIGAICLKRHPYQDGFFIVMIVGFVVGAIILLCVGAYAVDYITFESKFEIQREIYTAISTQTNPSNDNLIYIMDAVNSNSELAEYQASYKTYGVFSVVPARVMDIKPIGVYYD